MLSEGTVEFPCLWSLCNKGTGCAELGRMGIVLSVVADQQRPFDEAVLEVKVPSMIMLGRLTEKDHDMTNNVVSIRPSEKSRVANCVLGGKNVLDLQFVDDDGLGAITAAMLCFLIEALISIVALVAWFHFR
jgi:hypothetical protein